MRTNVGFLLAVASQRFNALLVERFAQRGFGDVRASFGSVLVPLFDQDGLRVGELASAARLSKQAMTGLVRRCEEAQLVERERDASDGRVRRPARGTGGSWLAGGGCSESPAGRPDRYGTTCNSRA